MVQTSSEPCPKCGRHYIIGQNSCSSCGLVFAKWAQKQEGNHVTGSARMEIAWQDVLNQWTTESVHKRFIDQCMSEHNLPFASLKYRKVLESDPHSEVAQKMQKKIQEFVVVNYMSKGLALPTPEKVYSNKPIYVLLFFCAFLVLLGFGMPGSYITAGLPLVIVGVGAFIAIQLLKRHLL